MEICHPWDIVPLNIKRRGEMSLALEGKIIIVTGSARGIGKATAKLLADEGATVVVSDILREQGEATAAEIGATTVFQPCDISDRKQVSALIDATVKRFGRLDVMVNNAGINAPLNEERVTIERFLDETWDRIMKVDLNGTFYCCRAAAAQMVNQGAGSIINISSVAGVVALRLQIAFVAAKAAIIKLTEAMACEIGPKGVRVNAISPGSVDITPGKLFSVPEEKGGYLNRGKSIVSFIPQGRLGCPEDIAEAVLFLASDKSAYVNGHNLVVDGGWTCGFNRDW
jgi:3-oxoacyl-[acyl-carrier protein] reductase